MQGNSHQGNFATLPLKDICLRLGTFSVAMVGRRVLLAKAKDAATYCVAQDRTASTTKNSPVQNVNSSEGEKLYFRSRLKYNKGSLVFT